jgi:molybdopterin molybdotransferase
MMALRAWLETIMPPVFGKERDFLWKADIPTRYRPFLLVRTPGDERKVEMKGFLRVQSPEVLLRKLDRFEPLSSTETVCFEDCSKRVLSEDIPSPVDLPAFRRSTVDGVALRAKDTYGASEKTPVSIDVVGEVPMGRVVSLRVADGQGVKVATGAMVPEGADAVQMLEYTKGLDSATCHVFKPVSPLENVIQIGEDVRRGEIVLRKRHVLRPQDIGLMAGLGITSVPVFTQPRVGIISSGDEIVPVENVPALGEVRDINRYTISSLVRENNGVPFFCGIVEDRVEILVEKIRSGLEQADMLIITGGSSVGSLDLTVEVLQSFTGTEVIAHGISIRPGKPTLLAVIEGKPFLGLPGHPVSALVIFHLFGRPILRTLAGWSKERAFHQERVKAKAARNIPSVPGREDYIRVMLEERDGTFLAHPLFGKSGALSHLVKADGLLKIGVDEEGLEEGSEAEVVLL